MDAPVIPPYIYDEGVISVERVGFSAMRASWRIDTANMTSRILRNTRVDQYNVAIHRDMMASTLKLGEYGPPPYEYSNMETREGDMILVEVRKYTAGATLLEVAPTLSDNDINNISQQIGEMVALYGTVVSPAYGSLSDPDTPSERCIDYMRDVRAFHVCAGGKKCCLRKLRTPRSGDDAVLCHNSLTPDHIIIHSGRIVAVVGWSYCDFGVMQLQAASYAYMLDLRGEDNLWLGQVVCQLLNKYSGRKDKMLRFCAAMHLCRLPGNKDTPWLQSLLDDTG